MASLPRNRGRAVSLLLGLLALVLGLGYCDSPRSSIIHEQASDFGRIRVAEAEDGLRSLYTGDGRARQSAVYPGRPEHLELVYSRYAMVGLALVPRNARILFVGLGGGAMPMFTRQKLPTAQLDVVEIDPVIVRVAEQYFGFTPDSMLRVHTGDGRAFIEQSPPGSFDLIFLDAFSDDEIPYTLSTRDFLEAVERALTPGGLVVSSVWNSVDDYESMLATYRAVFPQVNLLRVGSGIQRTVIAGPAEIDLSEAGLVAAARTLSREVDLGYDLVTLVEGGYVGDWDDAGAPVLEDR